MGNSHKNLLLRNHWANCNQTLVEWSLDGPLPMFCSVIPTSNQSGRQAKNRKRGDEIKKKSSPLKLLSQSQPKFDGIVIEWSSSNIVYGSRSLPPQCSCVVIESSFDPGERLQAPGSIWFFFSF